MLGIIKMILHNITTIVQTGASEAVKHGSKMPKPEKKDEKWWEEPLYRTVMFLDIALPLCALAGVAAFTGWVFMLISLP